MTTERARASAAPAPAGAERTVSHRSWRRRALAVFAVLGPGVVAANAGNDAGGIVTYASAGAQYAYKTLFVMLLITIALLVVQEMSARLGAYTGEGLVSLFREHFSLRLASFAVLMLLMANLGLVVSEFAGIGAAMAVFGVSRYLAVPVAAVVIWAVVVLGSYRYAERIFLLFTLAFLTYPVAAILGHPHWATVGKDLVIPHWQPSQSFLFLVVALIGTTITPYMQLYQSAAVADRGIGPSDYPAERVDTFVGVIFGDLISIFIIIATAAAFAGHPNLAGHPLASAGAAAKALRPVAGSGAADLFAIGLLGASVLAAAVVPLATAYALAEALGVERSVSVNFRQAPLFNGLFTALLAFGAVVALFPGNLISLLVNMQVLNGIITPVVLVFILILANRRSVLGDAANGRIYRAVAAVIVAVVGVLALVVLVQTLATG
jgi:Mn2+/Fe2+ NRAMP family transporter